MKEEVLKFSAFWCGPCKALSEALEGVDLSVPVVDVDVGDNVDAAALYGIRSVPTMVFVRDGVEVSRFSGSRPIDKIKEWVHTSQNTTV